MPIIPLPPSPPSPVSGGLLGDLFAFFCTADTSGLCPDRAAAIGTVRSMIAGDWPLPPGQVLWGMYPNVLAEGAKLPALSYQQISRTLEHDLSAASSGLYATRVQIDVWAYTTEDRDALAAAVIAALDGLAVSYMVSTEVNALLCDNAGIDSFEPSRLQYRRTLDFLIHHN
jgi:hypothetical protein